MSSTLKIPSHPNSKISTQCAWTCKNYTKKILVNYLEISHFNCKIRYCMATRIIRKFLFVRWKIFHESSGVNFRDANEKRFFVVFINVGRMVDFCRNFFSFFFFFIQKLLLHSYLYDLVTCHDAVSSMCLAKLFPRADMQFFFSFKTSPALRKAQFCHDSTSTHDPNNAPRLRLHREDASMSFQLIIDNEPCVNITPRPWNFVMVSPNLSP